MVLLTNFNSMRPPFETTQADTFDWLIEAHCQAERKKGLEDSKLTFFRKTLEETFWRVACNPGAIEKRGHILPDFLHQDWEKMKIYRLFDSPQGEGLSKRAQKFEEYVESVFDTYYPENCNPPNEIIHVSCTGYVSPSGAQALVSKRNWGMHTTVTHAYHMGCYGAFPAIRIGKGLLKDPRSQADIVHTEICSLHSNPSLHGLDQIVSQSLFADGFIKYTLSQRSSLPHLKVLNIHEEIIPKSIKSMTWSPADWGFQMSLSKELPVLITKSLESYLERLFLGIRPLDPSQIKRSLFAIHPGGPKILQYIQDLLQLSESQVSHSKQILQRYGNMSSATIPHIWQAMLDDPEVANHTQIISLAFGPGLSIAGAIMEKSCGN